MNRVKGKGRGNETSRAGKKTEKAPGKEGRKAAGRNKKLKILHIVHHFHPCTGGIESVIENECIYLNKLGHRNDVLCLNKCAYSDKILPEEGSFRGIKIFRIPFRDLKYYKYAPKVLDYVKGYDILHVHGIGFFSDYLCWKRKKHGKPVVINTHGGVFHTKKIPIIKKLYFNLCERILLNRADRVIADSRNDFNIFRQIAKNLELLENPVDISKFKSIRGKHDKNNFLYVGRLSRNKGIDDLIRAFYFVVKEKPEARLFIVGEDWEGIQKELEELVGEKGIGGRVVFTGRISDKELRSYMGKAMFSVSASHYEGFGVSIIEAMAAGMVPLINNIDSFRNFVEHGKTGFLLDYSKPELAAKIILNVAGKSMKELEALSANASAFAEKYSAENTAKKIEALYRKVVEESQPEGS